MAAHTGRIVQCLQSMCCNAEVLERLGDLRCRDCGRVLDDYEEEGDEDR